MGEGGRPKIALGQARVGTAVSAVLGKAFGFGEALRDTDFTDLHRSIVLCNGLESTRRWREAAGGSPDAGFFVFGEPPKTAREPRALPVRFSGNLSAEHAEEVSIF